MDLRPGETKLQARPSPGPSRIPGIPARTDRALRVGRGFWTRGAERAAGCRVQAGVGWGGLSLGFLLSFVGVKTRHTRVGCKALALQTRGCVPGCARALVVRARPGVFFLRDWLSLGTGCLHLPPASSPGPPGCLRAQGRRAGREGMAISGLSSLVSRVFLVFHLLLELIPQVSDIALI